MARDIYRDPIYNLKAVVEATGVTDDALRAWERRYGLPQPQRTEAGHRIYSQRDIDTIRWLVERQEEGLRIGSAVKLWRGLADEEQDPLRAMPAPADSPQLSIGDQVSDLRDEWLSGCLAFDERRAEHALERAFSKHTPEVVCLEIIREGIAEIGRRWYQGQATVQQEHFASQLAMRRIKALMSGTPPPTRRGRILIACPPDEHHVIGPFILALLLRRAGWEVVYLGPNVPLEHMEQTVDDAGPDLVILAAQQLHTAGSLLEVACSLQHKSVSVAFGGRIFNRLPRLRQRVPGHFLGATLEEAAEAAGSLLARSGRTATAEACSGLYEDALAHYLENELAVKAEVWQHLQRTDLPLEALQETEESFSAALSAALRFGDMELMDYYVDWVEHLGKQPQSATRVLQALVEAYCEATETHLSAQGAPIVQWLKQRVAQTEHGDGDAR